MIEQDWSAYFSGLSESPDVKKDEKKKEALDYKSYFDNLTEGEAKVSGVHPAEGKPIVSAPVPLTRGSGVQIGSMTPASVESLGKIGGNLVNQVIAGPKQMIGAGINAIKQAVSDPSSILPSVKAGYDWATSHEGQKEILKSGYEAAKGAVAYLPETAISLVKDPKKMVEERPLDVAMLASAVVGGGAKALGKIGGKASPSMPEASRIAATKLRVSPERQSVGDFIRQDEAPIKTKIKGTMPVYADEAAQLMQDAKSDISYGTSTETGAKAKRVYQNPIRVLEERPSTKRLYDAWRAAEDTTAKEFTSQVAPQIKTWRNEIKASGGTKERVAAYAISEQEGGPSILAAMKMDRPELNPGEMKVYGEMRATLDSFWNRVNEARKMSGQEPLDYRKNYYTWARDLDALKELGVDLIHDNASVVADKFIELQGTPFKYTSRTMKAIPVYLDLFRVYENYAKSALEAIHTTPVIAKGRALREPFNIDQGGKQVEWSLSKEAPEMDIYLDSWLNNIAGKKPTVSHQFMKPFARYAGKINKNIGSFALSFNPRTIGIQFTSLVNTYAKTGGRFLVEGILDNFFKSKRDVAYNKGNVMATRQYDIHAKEMLGDTARTKLGRAKEAVTDVGMWGIGKADAEVARISWLAFYNKAKKGLRLTEPEAVRYANDWTIKTQASAQRGDVSPLQTTPVGKSMSLFQTFVINNWNFLSKEVFGFKNPAMKTPERIATVSRLLIGTAIINELFEGQLGIPSPFPAPERAIYKGIKEGKAAEDIAFSVGKELAEVVPVIGTPIKFSSAYSKKSIPPVADVISDIPKSVEGTVKAILGKKSLNPSDLETLGKILGIQGGATVIKYWRRRKSGMSHLDAIMGVRPEYRKSDKSSAGW